MIFLLIAVLLIAGGLLWLLKKNQGGRALSAHDLAESKRAWHHIQELMNQEDESAWVRAIFEADKLLDWALSKKGVFGKNVGEKLKNGATLFSNVDVAWRAHKMRNTLAHERGDINERELAAAMSNFERTFRDLGIL